MSLTTNNGKMAVMDWESESEPGMLFSVTSFDTDIQQGLIWGIPEVSWSSVVTPAVEPNPAEPSSGAMGWSSREFYNQANKKRAILKDDEEMMRLIAMALPELLKRYYDD